MLSKEKSLGLIADTPEIIQYLPLLCRYRPEGVSYLIIGLHRTRLELRSRQNKCDMEVEVMRSHENRYGIQLQAFTMNAFINNEIQRIKHY